MKRLFLAALLPLALMGNLGGCQDDPTAKPELAVPSPVLIRRVEIVVPKVPKRLRTCRAEPAPLAAGQDCRCKLGAVDAMLAAAERRARGTAR